MNKYAEAIAEHDANHEPPQPNAPARERQPMPEKLTGREMVEELHPHTAAIFDDEESAGSIHEGINQARANTMSDLDMQRANADLMLYSNDRAEKPSAAVAERARKKIAAVKAKRANAEAEYARQLATTPGSIMKHITDWLNSPAVMKSYVHANTATDIRDGESVLEANARLTLELAALRVQKKHLVRAPLPAVVITANCHQLVAAAAAKANLMETIRSLRNVGFSEAHGFINRSPVIPQGNAFEVLCAIMPDMIAAGLATRALANHNEAGALDDVARVERLNEIEDRETAITYAAAANHRYARERGENPGPRVSTSVLAALDLRPA